MNRSVLSVTVLSLPSSLIVEALERAIESHGKPSMIRVDNGPEFTSKVFDSWAYAHRIQLDFITPGKPTENGFIESFNGKFRDDCLSPNWFESLDDACETIESWRVDYNETRPHSSLAGAAPIQYLATLIEDGAR